MHLNKHHLIIILICVSNFVFSQNDENQLLNREINEQIFDTDNFYPKNAIQSNKQFEPLNGNVKEEIIIFSDSTRIINNYNTKGSLTLSEVLKNGALKSTYSYEYEPDGTTISKERGVNKLNYTVYHKDKYSTKYYAVQASNEDQGLFYKYLDTLFINQTKYSYDFIKQSNSVYNPIFEYEYKFSYNNLGYLKQIQIFENDIKVGHFINNYNKNNQVISQELFWDYKWFVEDTGFPSVRNQTRKIEYQNGLIKSITNESYNPTSRKWETSVKNYDCNVVKRKKLTEVECNCDSGENIKIKIDYNGNWISKSIKSDKEQEVTKRELEYYE